MTLKFICCQWLFVHLLLKMCWSNFRRRPEDSHRCLIQFGFPDNRTVFKRVRCRRNLHLIRQYLLWGLFGSTISWFYVFCFYSVFFRRRVCSLSDHRFVSWWRGGKLKVTAPLGAIACHVLFHWLSALVCAALCQRVRVYICKWAKHHLGCCFCR